MKALDEFRKLFEEDLDEADEPLKLKSTMTLLELAEFLEGAESQISDCQQGRES